VVRQAHLIAVVGVFLVGCAVLLVVVGCAGVRSEAPKEEQAHSGQAASEEDRCGGTRKIDRGIPYITNDMRRCPKGGVLKGTEKNEKLAGVGGEDEVYGLGGDDTLEGGLGDDKVYGGPGDDLLLGAGYRDEPGDDVLYGGPGSDDMGGDRGEDVLYGGEGDDYSLHGDEGEDVLYGGGGDDQLSAFGDGQRDELYCGDGRDNYTADEIDVVADDCEPAETTVLNGLECANSGWVSVYGDYPIGAKGKKGDPVELARREFPKQIKEGDTVEIADPSRGQNAKATVRVIREGRVVALIKYRRVGGGWLRDYYEACGDF
jgi:hypothetical protein